MNLFDWFKRENSITKKRAPVLEYNGISIVVVRRRYQKTMRISVHKSGKVKVSCRMGIDDHSVRAFIQENSQWLERCLNKFREFRDSHPTKKFVEGEKFPFMGRDYIWRWSQEPTGSPIHLSYPYLNAVPSSINFKRVMRNLYEDKANYYLPRRLSYWAENMQLSYKNFRIKSFRSRWGSCNAKGEISLNWKLMVFPPEVIDYVLVHELAHLVHLNHSKSFWLTVLSFCPQYKKHREFLRKHQSLCEFLES